MADYVILIDFVDHRGWSIHIIDDIEDLAQARSSLRY